MAMHFFGQRFRNGEPQSGGMTAAGDGVKAVKKMTGLYFIESGSMVYKTKSSVFIHSDRKITVTVLGRITDNIRQNSR